jgi:integrase
MIRPSHVEKQHVGIDDITAAFRVTARSCFGDPVWYLVSDDTQRATGSRNYKIEWSLQLGHGISLTDRKCERLLHAAKLLLLVEWRGYGLEAQFGKFRTLRAGSVSHVATSLLRFLTWMVGRDILSFGALTAGHFVSYRNAVMHRESRDRRDGARRKRITDTTIYQNLKIVRTLIKVGQSIPGGSSIDPTLADELLSNGCTSTDSVQTTTSRIPDHVFVKLSESSLAMITDAVPDLLTLYQEAERMTVNERAGHLKRLRLWRNGKGPRPSAKIVRFGRTQNDFGVDTKHALNRWIILAQASCYVLIAGLTGMRVSEVLSLRSGCLSTLALADGRRLLLVNGTVFKTAQAACGEKADWVAGWDLPDNRVRIAIDALHRIQETCRSNRGRGSALFRAFVHQYDAREEWDAGAVNRRLNDLLVFFGVEASPIASHQFRKTFARFVALSDQGSIFALMRHFKHVSVAMTERYLPDYGVELWDEILDAKDEVVRERLSEIAGERRLAGTQGEQILRRRAANANKAATISETVDAVVREMGSRIVLHVYGLCFYDDDSAKCNGEVANVGFDTCRSCSNFCIAPSNLPYHRERLQRLEVDVAELRSLGMPSQHLEHQLAETRIVIERLGGPVGGSCGRSA